MSKKVPEGAALYTPMKKCMNCYHICDGSLTRCSQCGHLFLREATEEEKQESMERQEKMRSVARGDFE